MSVKSKVICAAGFALVSTVLLSTACSPESNDTQTLAVAVAPTSVNISAGGSGTSTVTITRGGGFTGAATLTSTGAPAGVTVAFSPAAIPAGATTSTATVTVGAAVAPGTYPIVVHADNSAVTSATATLSVVVLSADAGGFILAAAPATLTAPAGGAAQTSVITITRSAPFAGAVAFTVTGAPAGMTTSFNPISAPDASTTLSVTAGASTLNGTYTLVVRGTGVGVADATTNVSVTVTGGASAGVTLALAPASLAFTAGGVAQTSTLTVTRVGGFTGAVGVAVTGMPTNMTAVPNPASIAVGGTTSVITVNVPATVAAGNYDLIVTATGTGITATTITLPVTVAAPSGGGSVNITYCAEDAPIWVAIQDGSGGAWTRVNPTSGSSYTFSFPSGKGGIATVDTVGTGTDLSVIYGSLAEFTNAAGVVNFGGCGGKTLNGTVTNLGAANAAFISMGFSAGFVLPGGTTYTLNDVATGPQDLVARDVDGTTQATNKIIINRALNIADGGTIPNLDFSGGFAPGTANVTVNNIGTDATSVISLFYGIRGSSFAPVGDITNYTSGSQPISAIPVAQLQSGETQLLEASADGTNASRLAGVFFRTPGTTIITMGPALSAVTVTKAATTPYVRPQAQFTSQSEYNRLVSISYSPTTGETDMDIAATAGYFGAAPATWNLTFPDLSTVSGFNSAWGIPTGTSFNWSVDAQGGAIAFIDPNITDGATTQSASANSASPVTLRTQRTGNPTAMLENRLLQVFKRSNPMR